MSAVCSATLFHFEMVNKANVNSDILSGKAGDHWQSSLHSTVAMSLKQSLDVVDDETTAIQYPY